MPNQLELMLRLIFAGVFGAVIGLERKAHMKDAGLRTHFVVAVGASLCMIVSKYGFFDTEHMLRVSFDPSRIAAQVASGIGFLGAGMIIFHKSSVRGLTTAAGLWTTAGIGLATGSGMYVVSAGGTGLVIIGLYALKWLDHRLVGTIDLVNVIGQNSPTMIGDIGAALRSINVMIERIDFDLVDKESVTIGLYVKTLTGQVSKEQISQTLTDVPGVKQLQFGGQHSSM